MPLSGWICPGCHREVPLPSHKPPVANDHFEGPCGEIVHSDYANAVMKGRQGHEKDVGQVRVSNLIGCPRSYAIQQSENYYTDPLSGNSAETGTAWHSHMETNSVDPSNTEVEVSGTLIGIKVAGKVDRIRNGMIEDWKHQNDFAKKYLKEPKPIHVAQVSLYAELVAQSKGWRPTHGIIWNHFTTGMVPMKFPIMALGDVLAMVIGSGTVLDNLQEMAKFAASKIKWAEMRMVGEKIEYGQKTACDYCPVRGICWTEDRKAPF